MSETEKKVFYAEANYSEEEINAVLKVLNENRLALMAGSNVKELEKKVAKLFNKEFGLMVNSGSSANLLAVQSLELKKGSKVITPALTFSTTISPLVQSNLIPFFVDVEKETLQINTKKMKAMPLEDVSAICVPNLIGNIANWNEIYSFASDNDLKVIEDSADTIGYEYKSDFDNWSDVTTTSFYVSHVVTGAGFGGMVCFNEKKNYELGLSLRGWGRRSSLYGESEDYERRFSAKIDGLDYDDKYIFDGFRFDTDNNLWTSCGEGVACYSSSGEQIGYIKIPEQVSNVDFGGVDGKTLFITASSSFYMVDLSVRGAKFK